MSFHSQMPTTAHGMVGPHSLKWHHVQERKLQLCLLHVSHSLHDFHANAGPRRQNAGLKGQQLKQEQEQAKGPKKPSKGSKRSQEASQGGAPEPSAKQMKLANVTGALLSETDPEGGGVRLTNLEARAVQASYAASYK